MLYQLSYTPRPRRELATRRRKRKAGFEAVLGYPPIACAAASLPLPFQDIFHAKTRRREEIVPAASFAFFAASREIEAAYAAMS